MEYDSGHCIPSRPPSTGYPNTHYDPGGVVPPHPSVPWYRITTPAGPREVLPVPKIEDTLLSDRRDETTNEPFPSAGRSLTIIPLHRRLQFGRRCRKFAAPIFSPCSTGSAPPSWTWPASVRPSFSKCFSPLSIKVCAHRHVFCNPPLAGPSCWKVDPSALGIARADVSLPSGLSRPPMARTSINLTAAVPGSNLIPRHVIIMDARGKGAPLLSCQPRPGGRPRCPRCRCPCFHRHPLPCADCLAAAVVGILDALPPARLAALSRLPSPWVL